MLPDDVERVVQRNPGLTATEIARELFGDDAYQERVGSAVRILTQRGRIERRGAGGPGEPFTYHPRQHGAHRPPQGAYIVRLNIEHYRKRLAIEPDGHKRKRIAKLLAEEEAKLAALTGRQAENKERAEC